MPSSPERPRRCLLAIAAVCILSPLWGLAPRAANSPAPPPPPIPEPSPAAAILVERPADLDSPQGRALRRALERSGLLTNSLRAVEQVRQAVAAGDAELHASLARAPFALRLEPGAWSIAATLDARTAERLTQQAAARRLVRERAVFELDAGRTLYAIARRDGTRAVVVLAPADDTALFERTLAAVLDAPASTELDALLPPTPAAVPNGSVRMALAGGRGLWLAAALAPTDAGWRAEFAGSPGLPATDAGPIAAAALAPGALAGVVLPVPPNRLPGWPSMPALGPAALDGPWALRIEPEGLVLLATMASAERGAAEADRLMAGLLSPLMGTARVEDVSAGATVSLGGALPGVVRVQEVAGLGEPLSRVLGARATVAWRTVEVGGRAVLVAAAGEGEVAARVRATTLAGSHAGGEAGVVVGVSAEPAGVLTRIGASGDGFLSRTFAGMRRIELRAGALEPAFAEPAGGVRGWAEVSWEELAAEDGGGPGG